MFPFISRSAALGSGLIILLALPAGLRAQPPGQPPAQAPAQQLDPAVEARLERMTEHFRADRKLTNFATWPMWVPGEDRFLYWVSPPSGGGRWVSLDAATGTKTIVIEPADLNAQIAALSGAQPAPPVITSRLRPNGRAIDFLAGDKAYTLDMATRLVSQIPVESIDALALDPRNRISPLRDLAARGTVKGMEVVDGSGRSVFALEDEEFRKWQLPDMAWSPGGKVLLAWQIDARQVHRLPVVEYEGALERVRQVPYSKAGTPLEVAELHVVDPRTRAVRRLPVTDDEGYSFLAGWRKGAGEALILHLSRDGKRLDLFGVDPAGGQVRRILREERSETFVGDLGFILGGWARQITPLDDGFLWMSERDGWRHVYRYDYSGRLVGRVTRGSFPVHEIASVSPDGRSLAVLASANPAAPYDRLPYRVPMRGGRLVPLAADPGVHQLSPSSTGRYFVSGFSALDRPSTWQILAADGAPRRRYEARDASALFAWGYRPPEPFVATAADGRTPIHGVIFKPFDFDSQRQYPVIEYIYGGPFEARVPRTFVGNTDSRLASSLAQAGFIVVMVDSRGTPGRGKAFQDATYGRIGRIEIPDHVGALRQAASSRPYMDMSRVGIAGYSWGGYFALRGMLTAPEFYGAGYSGSPGELTEEAMVNEPNMDLPSRNPEGYRLGSNIAAAGRLQGALKIMHGTADTSAPLSTTMLMADALVKAGKRFELLLVPGAGHNLPPQQLDYVIRDMGLFFIRELGRRGRDRSCGAQPPDCPSCRDRPLPACAAAPQ
jgi:dipeptidyl aminopeptidase/acylaminoacyl peptidase